MTTITELHQRAMDIAADAEMAVRRQDDDAAQKLFREAFELEREAALLLSANYAAEPTRSVLLRSAASLALDCNEPREAECLIALGLAGDPPEEIAEELRDLYETATFQRHLTIKGTVLGRDELQMALAGSAVGLGIVNYSEYLPRLEAIESALIRIAERQMRVPFRDRGRPTKLVTEKASIYLSVPRPASFAITIKVGRPLRQKTLFEQDQDVVFEFLECMALYSAGLADALRSRLGGAYYRNFISLARKIEPDGVRVNTVGFTADSRNAHREVAVKKVPTERWVSQGPVKRETIEIVGILKSAHEDDKYPRRNVIGIRGDDERIQRVIVPKGLMNDIVRPHWGERVMASCSVYQGSFKLIGLKPE